MSLRATKPEKARPSKPKILIYGAPGVGKTWASLDFPGVYYIDTEGGANLPHYIDKLRKSGGVYLGPNDGACDFATVTDEIKELATTRHKFRTLVIDSYSKLFNTQLSIDLEKMEKKGKDISEGTYGAEKRGAIQWTRRWLRWFTELDMNVVLICHERDLWADGKSVGKTYDGWDKLAYELHLALQITKVGPARRARITKTRIEAFPDGETFDWSYQNFADRFGHEVIEAEAQAVALATPEQVEKYNELLDIVRLPDKVRDKWADAGDDPADMTTADLQKRIEWLQGQLKGANK